MMTAQDKVLAAAVVGTYTAITVAAVTGGLGDGIGSLDIFNTDEAPSEEVFMTEGAPSLDPSLGEGLGIAFDMPPIREPTINVDFPVAIPFVIDPFEINGRGQIFSENHPIANFSDVDVIVRITALQYTFKNDTDFLALDLPYNYRQPTYLKAVNMLLKSNAPDFSDVVITNRQLEQPVEFYLKASAYDESGNWIALNEGSEIFIFLAGSVSESPAVPWADDDITLTLEFEIIPILPVMPVMPVPLPLELPPLPNPVPELTDEEILAEEEQGEATDEATDETETQTMDEATDETADQTTDETATQTTGEATDETATQNTGETTDETADQTADKGTDEAPLEEPIENTEVDEENG